MGRIKETAIRHAAVALLLTGISTGAHSTPIADDLVLADVTACKKPRLAPPPPIKESYQRYNFQRRYIDLDGSGTCVLMDIWVDRLGGSPSAGMRLLEHQYMRFVGGKCQPFVASFRWYPHALKDRTTGKVYLVDAPAEEDLGDFMVLKTGVPRVFMVAGWTSEKGFTDTLILQEVNEERAEILLALARRLEPRATPALDRNGAERARIRMLREAGTKHSPRGTGSGSAGAATWR